ncbi:MAG: hypothetical protein IJM45_04275 [Clostridia bacterium]|nr:hypothetical protein [Clostridia bacterium]
MKLSKYDNKRVRIVTPQGEIFEGVCRHNGREYTEHEFGRDEESLQLPYFLFYKRDIKKIEILPDGGPYGGYSGRYGLLEETAVCDGADAIEEVLSCEEDEHVFRLILCIEDHLALAGAGGLPDADVLSKLLSSVPGELEEKTVMEIEKTLDMIEHKR